MTSARPRGLSSMARRFEAVAAVLQAQVEAGRMPGFVAAVRYRGTTEVLVGGRLAVGDSAPMRSDTLFRLASVTKPFGGALTLALIEDGVLGPDDVARTRPPEPAAPPGTPRPGGPAD